MEKSSKFSRHFSKKIWPKLFPEWRNFAQSGHTEQANPGFKGISKKCKKKVLHLNYH
jgi:hypothetical protein